VLDTSALVAYLTEEPEASAVAKIRKHALLPFMVVSELYYLTYRKHDQMLADEVIQQVLSWKLPLLTVDERICISAGYLKARYSLGIADSFIAALTLAQQATLVTKDPDYNVIVDLSLLQLNGLRESH
jgi:predicted nucleic acid-binding protein